AYKSALLVRLLIKRGAEVQVVMTPSAKEFITPVTLSALTGKPVVSEFFTANTGEWHSHVDLGLWADAMVIAPATACTIGKMANGVADNMLVTTYLSAKAPVFVAPAMDLDMMAHPSTTRNLELLRSYGNHVIEPASGELASHLVGRGRMEEPENIVRVLDDYFASSSRLAGKKVLITAGPTYERIDPVRFIGNFSTGKMGYALADAAARAGAEVTVVSGPVSVRPKESSVKVIPVESACQMADRCMEIFPQTDIAIMCAAVADYAPAEQLDKKLKRGNCETMTLELRRNPDIAAMLGKNKRDGQILVGFALETDNEEFNACRKMESKNLDLIVLNSLAVPGAGFATDTNAVSVFFADGRRTDIPLMSKADVAGKIISLL
ncbi:MAG: bifunctional phosphopantothenoylcysteine decarboxylase/phosphopantothenate--cysteine ligase CoaBC, partial [Paramuribaculum sp.]|nr:bifunctional phosphopantothenoylcysteine decarboxylase/phosphopantothenate--cysteine ligase CoaBC [Paramuribaculum sp.]